MVRRSAKLLVLLFVLVAAVSQGAERRMAFERAETVNIANLEVSVMRKLADGIMPAISPDAARVAFTTVEKSEASFVRHIAIAETASGKITIASDIPSDNSSQPNWSPNSDWVAFTFAANGIFRLGRIRADGTGFKYIRNTTPDQASLYSPCWARDGFSVFCQDTTNLYRLGLDGAVLGQWKISRIVPNGAMSPDSRIDLAPDGNRLLLSIEMDEEHTRKDWDGPVPALWSFDLTTQTAVRLTSKNLFAWDGCWLDNANILFLSQRSGQKEAALYRTDGKSLKRLFEGVRRPSVSKP